MNIRIEDLYPDATEEERRQVKRRLDAYVRLILRIEERLNFKRVDEKRIDP